LSFFRKPFDLCFRFGCPFFLGAPGGVLGGPGVRPVSVGGVLGWQFGFFGKADRKLNFLGFGCFGFLGCCYPFPKFGTLSGPKTTPPFGVFFCTRKSNCPPPLFLNQPPNPLFQPQGRFRGVFCKEAIQPLFLGGFSSFCKESSPLSPRCWFVPFPCIFRVSQKKLNGKEGSSLLDSHPPPFWGNRSFFPGGRFLWKGRKSGGGLFVPNF